MHHTPYQKHRSITPDYDTTKSMDDVHTILDCMYVCISGVLRQGGRGNCDKEGEYRESRTH